MRQHPFLHITALLSVVFLCSCSDNSVSFEYIPEENDGPPPDPSKYLEEEVDPVTATLQRVYTQKNATTLKQWGLAIQVYSNKNGGDFPLTIGELQEGEYIADDVLWEDPANRDVSEPIYHAGHSQSSPPKTIILAGTHPNPDGTRDVGYSDLSTGQITEEEYQAKISAQ